MSLSKIWRACVLTVRYLFATIAAVAAIMLVVSFFVKFPDEYNMTKTCMSFMFVALMISGATYPKDPEPTTTEGPPPLPTENQANNSHGV